ncbi:MAG: hypothetical protein ACK40M_01990 [Flavobacteriales bacterium]
MKLNLKLLLIVAVNTCFLSCENAAEESANEWCRYNEKVKTASNEKEQLHWAEKARELEEEIKTEFGSDPESMNIIYTITNECD